MDSFRDLPGAAAPVLTAEVLGRINQLNCDYLELLITGTARCGLAGAHSLPDRVLVELSRASPEARRMLASAAFSLFSFGFENQGFWRSALRCDLPSIERRYGTSSAKDAHTAFCELALIHAWHVAVSMPVAASLVYGMPKPVVDGISAAQLWQLRRIAVDYPALLTPRWPANPCFWPEMIKFAATRDLRRLHTLQQLGHQLIAIDLQSSGDRRSAVRERQHNLLKQRLHLSKTSS